MPIVAYNNHPSIERIAKEGQGVITQSAAKQQDIRGLHIGFLNMMPDAAFLATERQFFRLLAASTSVVQIYIHPIKCQGVKRNASISRHIDDYYRHFDAIRSEGLDAVIVTGANPELNDLTQEAYWQDASQIFQWAQQHVASIFCSCLSSHALLQLQYQLKRQALRAKLWGIYAHRVVEQKHPLVSNINTRFDMPHSRKNDISTDQLRSRGLNILITGETTGTALATSPDGFRQIFCQGHPEYDTASLLKEYKREVSRFLAKERADYPAFPANYLSDQCLIDLLEAFKFRVIANRDSIDNFPNAGIGAIDNTWRDTAKSIFSNWVSLVYRLTHFDRKKQFMDGVDPEKPLASLYQ